MTDNIEMTGSTQPNKPVTKSHRGRTVLLSALGLIAILATEATIASNQYRNVIQSRSPRVRVAQKACPLFVPLVEEGRDEHNLVLQAAVAEYLEPIRRLRPAVAVLGCTHYPLLRTAIAEFLGEEVLLIDTADATALAVEGLLRRCEEQSVSSPEIETDQKENLLAQ